MLQVFLAEESVEACSSLRRVICSGEALARELQDRFFNRLPEEARLQLMAVPFTPTYAEYIYLKGRRVLADQMEYLLTHFPRSSPLHARLRDALAEVNRRQAS